MNEDTSPTVRGGVSAKPSGGPKGSLAADGLRGGYGGLEVVRGIDLVCKSSEIVGIIGPNGAGKSTFVKCLMGLTTRHGGRVLLGGDDVSSLRADELAHRGIGYLPQVDNVFPSLTVKENFAVCRLLLNRIDGGSTVFAGRVEEVLTEAPELKRAWGRQASTLSGGEQKLLGLCRLLVQGAQVLVIDEPTAGLSERYAKRIWGWLRDLADRGIGLLVVEQNVALLLDSAHRIYVFVDGRVTTTATATEIGAQDLAQVFFGEPVANSNSRR